MCFLENKSVVFTILPFESIINLKRRDIMPTTTINFKVDEEVKEQAQEIFKEMGLNMTTAFNMFLAKTIQERQLPFQPTANKKTEVVWEELSPIIQEKIDFAISEIGNGENYSIQDLVKNKEKLRNMYE